MADLIASIDDLRRAAAADPLVAQWAPMVVAPAEAFAEQAQLTPLDLGLDVLAIIRRETDGQNIRGDGGHGRGLMQIDDRFHGPWLAANEEGMDPASNILEGTRIYVVDTLCVVRAAAARMALPPPEESIRRTAMAGYNAGPHRCAEILVTTGDPDKVDKVTTNKNYGAWTWKRRQSYAAAIAQASLV